ncbi:MAG: hypothetical protein NVSMB65_11940 [Chloroflexota bacterium]
MPRVLVLPIVFCLACAAVLIGGAVVVAAWAGDSLLVAGTICAAGGVLLLSSWEPRAPLRGGFRRRRGRVRKALAAERLLHDAGVTRRAPRDRVHHAA